MLNGEIGLLLNSYSCVADIKESQKGFNTNVIALFLCGMVIVFLAIYLFQKKVTDCYTIVIPVLFFSCSRYWFAYHTLWDG